jgi:chemotaxis protein histidine kinase CheA
MPDTITPAALLDEPLLLGLLAEVPATVVTGVLPLIDAGIAHLAARLGDLSSAGAEPAARAAHSLAGAASTVGLRWTAQRARETETALRRGEAARAAAITDEIVRTHPTAIAALNGFLAGQAA